MSATQLILAAQAVLNPVYVGDRLFGDVGAALVTRDDTVFTGVCIDTPTWGTCAERAAIAAMVTAGEYRIRQIVAVWREWDTGEGDLYVLPPCGTCREFIRQVDPDNVATEVVLGRDDTVLLGDLLPHSEWPSEPVGL